MVSRTSKPVPVTDEISSRKLMRRSQLIVDCLRRRPTFVLLLLPVAFLASFYVVSSEKDYDLEPRYPSFVKSYNAANGKYDRRLADQRDG